MRHFIRDSIIWWYDVSGKIGRYRRQVAAQQPLLRIVAFHDVSDETWFRRVIELLFSRYHLVTPDDLLEDNLSSTAINILLTFDDGYQSWLDAVVPVLQEYDAKGLFFVCSGLLDAAEDTDAAARFMEEWLRIWPRQPLTWDGTEMLLEYGHTLGGHTVTHPNLAALSKPKREEEIKADKERIETVCRLRLDYFAFPFGATEYINKASVTTARSLGYSYAMSAIPGFAQLDRFVLPRVLLEDGQSMASITRWMEGGYDLFYQLKTRTRLK